MAALSAVSCEARKVFEMNATVTPKRDSPNTIDPYLKENFLNLRETGVQEDSMPGSHIVKHLAEVIKGGDANKIVSTSDIDNYFNLQITTKLYFGSQ